MSKTDWINTYSGNRPVQKFQAGGPTSGAAPGTPQAGDQSGQGGGQQGPDLEGMLKEYAQTRDPQLAVAICDSLVQMMAQQQGGPAAGGAQQAGGMAPSGPEAPAGRRGMKMGKAPIF